MYYYRVYFMDAFGHICDVREMILDSDAAAEAEAIRINHPNTDRDLGERSVHRTRQPKAISSEARLIRLLNR